MYKYKTINTRSLKGLKLAEQLHQNGWKLISRGLFLYTYEKRIS